MPVDFSLSAGLIVLCQAVESVLQFGVLFGVEIRQSLEECHQKPNMVGPNAGIPVAGRTRTQKCRGKISP